MLLDYQLNQIYSSINGKITPQEKSNYVNQIVEILYQIKNLVILDDYIKTASYKLEVSENILKTQILNKQNEEFGILKIENDDFENSRKLIQKDSKSQIELMEENIIKLTFSANDNEKKKYIEERISTYTSDDETISKILSSIEKTLQTVNNVDELAKKLFLEFYNNNEIQKKISDDIFTSQEFNNLTFEDYKKAIDETFVRLDNIKKQIKKEKLKKMLKDDSISQEEKLKISQQIFQGLINQ